MTAIGTVIDGKYEVLREIGHGGMSTVYLAMDTHLNKQWAVKEIRKQGSGKNDEIVVNSLLAEANMMKRLDHPALPRIVDIIDNGVTIYVVMDYIEGESLDKILETYGPQPEGMVIGWAKQLCDALSYLHAQRPPIIYRDMKPANVMLKPEGNIKIIDFGIAREYKEQALADTTVLGIRGYAPPEQYNGQTDARSDIYALGMTMHHLLTGIDPRNGDPYAPVRNWNPELSEGIEVIIDKCTQPAAENRYQSCSDLLYDLEHPELVTQDFRRTQKRKLTTFLVAAGLGLALVISGFVTNRVAVWKNNQNYEAKINLVSSTPLDTKIENYGQAVGIYPDDVRAYMCMLEAYEEEGAFNSYNEEKFLSYYNIHKDEIERRNPQQALELQYKIGQVYFNYYEPRGSQDSFSDRVKKARDYFDGFDENAFVGAEEDKLVYKNYAAICEFYNKYIFASKEVENAFETFDGQVNQFQEMVNDVDKLNKYDQLLLLTSVSRVLFDQKDHLARAGVDQNKVMSLLESVRGKTEALTVFMESSEELKKEVRDQYETYRNNILTAYSNAARPTSE